MLNLDKGPSLSNAPQRFGQFNFLAPPWPAKTAPSSLSYTVEEKEKNSWQPRVVGCRECFTSMRDSVSSSRRSHGKEGKELQAHCSITALENRRNKRIRDEYQILRADETRIERRTREWEKEIIISSRKGVWRVDIPATMACNPSSIALGIELDILQPVNHYIDQKSPGINHLPKAPSEQERST